MPTERRLKAPICDVSLDKVTLRGDRNKPEKGQRVQNTGDYYLLLLDGSENHPLLINGEWFLIFGTDFSEVA